MKAVLLGITFLVGCGEVVPLASQGAACTGSTDCVTGNCVDGVCCDGGCSGQCEGCVASKTGGPDGTCTPVIANTDPDVDCPATCSATGAVHGTCSGTAACTMTTTSCGLFACAASTITCNTSCTDNSSCSATGFCNAAHVCAKRLRVALETGAGSCTIAAALAQVKTALEARGHTATIVSGADIDTAAEIANFDVVVTGAVGAPCAMDDRATYDAALGPWVMGGGGLVASGWVLFSVGPANFAALMPSSGNSFISGAPLVTPVGTHPIVAGLTSFTAQATFLPWGGTPKAGTTQLLQGPANENIAQLWARGAGRVVFDGPLHIDDFTAYHNETMTDGSNAMALEIFLRMIDWAGGSL